MTDRGRSAKLPEWLRRLRDWPSAATSRGALANILVPSYILDTDGIVRWINPAAERLLGNVRGRHFTSVVGPEDRARASELFARKVLGTTEATKAGAVVVSGDGTRIALEVSAVPLIGGG